MQPAPRRRKQLVTKVVTVPSNLERACKEFNAGLFYEAHESIEELWQMERGPIRDLYKGLIQLAAAFVHLSRGKYIGAERLLRTALGYLGPYRAQGEMGFDVEAICTDAEDVYRRLIEAGPDGVGRLDLAVRPLYVFDAESLRKAAISASAWGFDDRGNAVPMTITVAE